MEVQDQVSHRRGMGSLCYNQVVEQSSGTKVYDVNMHRLWITCSKLLSGNHHPPLPIKSKWQSANKMV